MLGNNIADPTALKELHNIQYLNLAKNKVKNVACFCQEESFVNLRYLNLSNNKFTELPNFTLPKLEFLDISSNKLEKVNEAWTGHPSIKILNASDNKFKSMAPFKNLPKCQELYISNNAIVSLTGLDGMASLRVLHVRHNKIEKVEEEGIAEIPTLETLNLRTNKIPDLDNLFRLFAAYPNVKNLNLLNCPVELAYSSMNLFLADVLAKKPDIKRFCKVDVNDKNKLEAVYLAKYKWEKAEAERKKLEEEERRKAEQEGEG